jgi:hypothetical protein
LFELYAPAVKICFIYSTDPTVTGFGPLLSFDVYFLRESMVFGNNNYIILMRQFATLSIELCERKLVVN